jgi:peptidoglycan-associated lipoprotein
VRDVAPVQVAAVDPLNDPHGALAKRSVYFDFDNYAVKPDYAPVVNAHAGYLRQHERTVMVQGNTDERGGTEYNLALGQKRAEAVRQALVAMGVPAARVEAVSYGKEKPKAAGHDEAAWSENRRADLAYQ